MSVSDAGAISAAPRATAPAITGPDPSPTRRGPAAAAAAAATPAVAPEVAPGAKRKARASSADDWANKITDPRQPPAAVKMQSTSHDHMWWKNSRAEEYTHMAGAEPATELRRRSAPGVEHLAVPIPSPNPRSYGGVEVEDSLRKKSAAPPPQSPPSAGAWTERMASAAKRLKQSAADALPHVSPASDIAGELQAQAQAKAQDQGVNQTPSQQSGAPVAGARNTPASASAPSAMDWSTEQPNAQRSPKATATPLPHARGVDAASAAAGKSPLQKLREMIMRKPQPTQTAAQAQAQAVPQSPRSAMSKPGVSHAAPVMDIGSPLPPMRQTEPRAAGAVATPKSPSAVTGTGGGTAPPPPTFWGSVKGLFRRARAVLPAFDVKPASDIKPSDRASDK